MNLTYQKAKNDHFSEILPLSLLANKDNSSANKETLSAAILLAIKNNLLWVVLDLDSNNKVVGFISCEYFDSTQKYFPNSIFIADLFVLKEYRQQGIGTELVNLVLKDKYNPKYTSFSVTHNPNETHLTDFYSSCGFTKIGVTKAGNVMLIKKCD